jgi:precorrin-3B methylase
MAATFAKFRDPSVPVILAQRLGSAREAFIHTDVERLPSHFGRIDFATLLLVGTSRTRLVDGQWVTL